MQGNATPAKGFLSLFCTPVLLCVNKLVRIIVVALKYVSIAQKRRVDMRIETNIVRIVLVYWTRSRLVRFDQTALCFMITEFHFH